VPDPTYLGHVIDSEAGRDGGTVSREFLHRVQGRGQVHRTGAGRCAVIRYRRELVR